MPLESKPVCVGVVLSAGGLRGVAHLGVLREIARNRIPVDVIVGVSAGAIVAAYYAAVGLGVQEMIDEVPTFRRRHIVMHGVTLRSHRWLKPFLRRFCGVIPRRLAQLDAASFAGLHHGIKRLGIVCHDVGANRPRYFSTMQPYGVRLADVARASAAVPGVLPAKDVAIGGDTVRLADGGISDSLPIDFIRSPLMGATHVIVSDCRHSVPTLPPEHDSLIYLRPDLDRIRTLRAPRTAMMKAVSCGEATVTPAVVARVQQWTRVRVAV